MDNDELTGLVFVDFQKAFDVLDHNVLLKKLSVYGARPDSVAWFQSYLAGWRQFVKLGHTPSQPKPVRQGVLQGSILCPFLFLLFVRDMPLHLNKSTMIYMLTIPPCPCMQTGTISLLYLRLFLMIWRISRNGQLETKCTSIPRRPKHYLLQEKGYNISFVRKQQAYNYTLIPQISTKYCITSYWV